MRMDTFVLFFFFFFKGKNLCSRRFVAHLGLVQTDDHCTRVAERVCNILKYIRNVFYVQRHSLQKVQFNAKLNNSDHENQKYVPRPAANEFQLILSWIYEVTKRRHVIQCGYYPRRCPVAVHRCF